MSSITKLPERLRQSGGLQLEQRLLNAAAGEEPSRELIERMARTIGVAVPTAVPPAALRPETSVPDATSVTHGAATGSGSLAAWVTGGVAVLGVAGALLVGRTDADEPRVKPALTAASAAPPTAMSPPAAVPQTISEPPRELAPATPQRGNRAAAPDRRSVEPAPADLAGQIALLDAARDAVAAGAGARALELVRQYQTTYPAGSFGPEAAAIRIEALLKLGRSAEAKALAERFVARHRSSPLAERVARLSGLASRP